MFKGQNIYTSKMSIIDPKAVTDQAAQAAAAKKEIEKIAEEKDDPEFEQKAKEALNSKNKLRTF